MQWVFIETNSFDFPHGLHHWKIEDESQNRLESRYMYLSAGAEMLFGLNKIVIGKDKARYFESHSEGKLIFNLRNFCDSVPSCERCGIPDIFSQQCASFRPPWHESGKPELCREKEKQQMCIQSTDYVFINYRFSALGSWVLFGKKTYGYITKATPYTVGLNTIEMSISSMHYWNMTTIYKRSSFQVGLFFYHGKNVNYMMKYAQFPVNQWNIFQCHCIAVTSYQAMFIFVSRNWDKW